MRRAGAGRRSDLLGGDPPHPSSEIRSRRRSAYAAGRQMVVAYGLDPYQPGDASRREDLAEVRARHGEGPVPRLDDEISLPAPDRGGCGPADNRLPDRWTMDGGEPGDLG